MPSRTHAKMLISQLERAESVVKDLFLEATDEGRRTFEAIQALFSEPPPGLLEMDQAAGSGASAPPDAPRPAAEVHG